MTEFLLKAGADPNVMDGSETLLDYAESDLWYHKHDKPGPGWESDPDAKAFITNLEEIIRMLKEHGAVTSESLELNLLRDD
ncbi:MAG: hypothetical protein AAGU11_02145 [Syntrophobacteraceae bacterium]